MPPQACGKGVPRELVIPLINNRMLCPRVTPRLVLGVSTPLVVDLYGCMTGELCSVDEGFVSPPKRLTLGSACPHKFPPKTADP